jgi:type II secretory ATPase GspE/PulE/Tfp pilus assembly ATPase PilB-like protein
MPANARPVFEVATIKPSNPDRPGKAFTVTGRQFATINTTLSDMITFAYGIHAKQITGGPSWVETEKYDLSAQPDGEGHAILTVITDRGDFILDNLDDAVALCDELMHSAILRQASDIHIEPDKKGTRIRYRIDGVLRDLLKPPAGIHAALVSRIKVIGKMDIAEKRLPQEGRVRICAEGRDIDLRVSSMPTLLGEKLVIRILDKSNLQVRMEDLGFRTEALTIFKRVLQQPHGLALVTGPTGSGKTTTLYSALDLLRSPELNIITIEDPIEFVHQNKKSLIKRGNIKYLPMTWLPGFKLKIREVK